MAIDPKRVAVQVALRTLQLSGETQAELTTSYSLGFATLDGADVPVTALVDAVLATEAELAEVIANDAAHPYRKLLRGRSEFLAHKDEIPTTDEDGVRFIGVFSGVNDASDNEPLTRGSIQEIRRYNRTSDAGRYTTDIRLYEFFNGQLHHTRTRAYIDGCVWNRNTAYNRITTAGDFRSPLPTSLESTWVARTIQFLASEGWLINEAQFYGNFAESGFARLRNRSLDMPVLPDQAQASNPVAN